MKHNHLINKAAALGMGTLIGSVMMAGVMSAAMTGCSSRANPLARADKVVAAKFLVHASKAAELKLNFPRPGGYYYGMCMSGKEKQAHCQKLYLAMSQFAAGTENFKGITPNEIADQKLFKSLKDDYERVRFNQL